MNMTLIITIWYHGKGVFAYVMEWKMVWIGIMLYKHATSAIKSFSLMLSSRRAILYVGISMLSRTILTRAIHITSSGFPKAVS